MTTLNINGRKVTVNDSFQSLSADEQNATVEEIAKSLGGGQSSAYQDTANELSSITRGMDKTPQAEQPQQTYGGALNTWLENAISGIPVAGPLIQKGTDYLATEGIGAITGQDPAQMRADLAKRREQRNEMYPASAISGQLGGAVAGTAALGGTNTGAQLLGVTGDGLLARAGASAATNGLMNATDTAIRGGDAKEVLGSGTIGTVLGGGIPLVGEGINRAISAVGNKVSPIVDAIRAPEQEAARRVGTAITRDATADPAGMVGPVDEAVARVTGVPLMNADRGGETTRALARSVANQSPEARATIEKAASDRFGTQGQRATDFVKLITGGAVDDVGYQQTIRDAARFVNKPAYERAFTSPEAQAMWDKDFQQFMQAPAVQKAAMQATTRGANRAAAEGFTPVRNPFTIANGKIMLRRNADGSIARPNLQFWDQTKQNLDDMIGAAMRNGEKSYASDLLNLKNQMVRKLDEAVPLYQKARQGAASYFGASDAIEAGKNFANSPRRIPEAAKAFAKFSGPEKAAFQTGFASELIDKIKATGDRTNVINRIFKSQAAREQIELVFGPQKARQVEAYVRVEDLADRLRGALGNSTTARQLVELGIGAAGGYAYGGDLTSAGIGALVAKGGSALAGHVTGKAETEVMKAVAKMLTSDDPKIIQAAVKQAAQSPAYMKALERWSNILALPARGAAQDAGRGPSNQPLELTVTRSDVQ